MFIEQSLQQYAENRLSRDRLTKALLSTTLSAGGICHRARADRLEKQITSLLARLDEGEAPERIAEELRSLLRMAAERRL